MAENLLGAMGQLADPTAAFQQGFSGQQTLQSNQQALAGQQQNQQVQAFALQQAQQQAAQQQARQQAYTRDVAAFTKNPTSTGAANMALNYPEQHDAIKQSFEMRDKAAQDADRQGLALVYSSLDNNRPELALDYLTKRQEADAAAGKPEPMVDTLLASLKADPTGKAAKGMSAYILSAIPGGDDFAKTLTAVNANGESVVVGNALVNRKTGAVVYQGATEPKYQTVKNADGTESIVALGGTPGNASGGSGRFTGGWTPRARNGGDNPDPVVDSKISGAAQFLGVDPNADISTVSPLKIAQAMTLSEGGKGSLADRNNNPANIRGPGGEGGYRKYPTKQAGLNAAAALVARKLKNGQTTVQTLIEGVPVGGASSSGITPIYTSKPAADTGSGLTGDAYLATLPPQRAATLKAIAEGRTAAPKPGTKFGQALLEQVNQYDPSFDGANAQSRQKTRVDFTSGKSAVAVNALNTAMGHLIHLDDQAHDLGNFETMPGLVNPIYNSMRVNSGNTALPAFDQTKQAAASEMRKVFAGAGGGNLTELEAWEKSLNSSLSYPQLHAAIANGVKLMGSRLDALKDQYTTGMQRSDQVPTFLKPSLARKAAQQFGVDLSHNADSPAERQAGTKDSPVAVTSPQQAARLPSGSYFRTPDGQIRVKH